MEEGGPAQQPEIPYGTEILSPQTKCVKSLYTLAGSRGTMNNIHYVKGKHSCKLNNRKIFLTVQSHIFRKHTQSSRKSDLLKLFFAIFIHVYIEFLLLTCPLPCFPITPISSLSSPLGWFSLFIYFYLETQWTYPRTVCSLLQVCKSELGPGGLTSGLPSSGNELGPGGLTSGYTANGNDFPFPEAISSQQSEVVKYGEKELKFFPQAVDSPISIQSRLRYSCVRFMIKAVVSCQEDGFPRLFFHLLAAWTDMSVAIPHILLQTEGALVKAESGIYLQI